MRKKEFILSLDIGTSSVRAALYDLSGAIIPQTFIKTEWKFAATRDGGSELDAEAAFREVVRAIDLVLEKYPRSSIAAVASCAFWHSLLGINKTGKPTTKLFGWAENRPAKYIRILREKFKESTVHNRTGCRFHSSYWPAKLFWLRKEHPKVFAKTDKWLSFSDFVAMRFFGERVTSVSMASGTGIFDIRKCMWDQKLIDFLKIKEENLPAIAAKDSETFQLNMKFASRWPQLKDAKWFLSIGDGAANNIGSGSVTKTKAALMTGTSGAMRVAYKGEPPKKIPKGLFCYRIDRKKVVIGGALSDGGNLYRWLRENLRLPKNAEELIAKRRIGSHGLEFQPFLAGERGTGYNEFATGAIIGLKISHDAVDILQAALESVADRLADIFKELNKVCRIRKIRASGGALRVSRVWIRIIADAFGKDIILADTREASLRGAVLHAIETIGKIDRTK